MDKSRAIKQERENDHPLYYSDYLHLDKILAAQFPESAKHHPTAAHDETLFIIVHQSFELWFKQVLHELDSVLDMLSGDRIDDNSEIMGRIVQRLQRIARILHHANGQFNILETMQPLDFLEFRGLLNPSSGFQSKQFRLIEARLGLTMQQRHMPEHYKNAGAHHGGFSEDDHREITEAEEGFTLLKGIRKWLERMPFFDDTYWLGHAAKGNAIHPFLSSYLASYTAMQQGVLDRVNSNPAISETIKAKATIDFETSIQSFRHLFIDKGTDTFSANELASGLFILLYKEYPVLRLPFEVISSLTEIDEQMSAWRYRHYNMVRKTIGTRPGTGGSPGATYLLGALQQNKVFNDLTLFTTYFIERKKLPELPVELKQYLSFVQIG